MNAFIHGIIFILLYFVTAASSALIARALFTIPTELFRKALHLILLGSLWAWLYAFELWWQALVTVIGFVIIVYPCLKLAEHIKGYSRFVTERRDGELKSSLVVVYGMFSLVIFFAWGLVGSRELALASVFAWGFGDAAAALIGKRFGHHHFTERHIMKKSWEGTLAMLTVSFMSVLLVLAFSFDMPFYAYPLTALVTAVISALAELYSTHGNDTIICPLSALAVLTPMLYIFGGLK